MSSKKLNITLALGLNENYEHKAALGAIKFARTREDWRIYGDDWLFDITPGSDKHKIDGIIARITDETDLERLKSYKVPVIDIAGSFDDREIYSVLNDDRLTGFMAGRHLLSRGLKNLIFLGVKDRAWSENRLDGIRDSQLESDDCTLRIQHVDPSWAGRETNLSALVKWLKTLDFPCGLFAANDNLGYKVILAAALAGITMPDQLSVIGVDNEEVFCELAQPSMTSIPCDCEKIGSEAAAILARILDGETVQRSTMITPWPIVKRDSTNIMIGDDQLIRDVKKFIRANIGKGINVADVVAAFPLSRRALEMRFNRSGDRTMHDEILSVRLEMACRLLEEGKNATEAALGSGFATNQHFHHVFKKYLRMTPSAYCDRLHKRETKIKQGDAKFLPIAPV